MENHKLIISPKTKVLQLLEAYPQLEDLLIGYVPAFKKLKKLLMSLDLFNLDFDKLYLLNKFSLY